MASRSEVQIRKEEWECPKREGAKPAGRERERDLCQRPVDTPGRLQSAVLSLRAE